ncbi:signal peptidase I [Diaminobutyricibacter tongyongensis]|uniref:Signal peptidase I n=1 Tax=Leifsonia tongyongensis TaxID=1268043 RepID=A0A6L9XX56_9MICO|nr:signal peptidase I [Diaminobutyricibacter tongyongensis]NEN05973.1 signal peptidase I [Diaminobutyricibacter tongyongensis]
MTRTVLTVVGTALASGLLAVVLAIGVFAVAVPAATGSATYTILTSSMKPGLSPGTFVVVQRRNAEDLHVGDIITYQLVSGKPEVVTHRIVKVMVDSGASRTFIVKGDNNAVADAGPVQAAQIRGKVWYAIPYVGWIAYLRSTSIGLFALAIAGWALVLYGVCMILLTLLRRRRRCGA